MKHSAKKILALTLALLLMLPFVLTGCKTSDPDNTPNDSSDSQNTSAPVAPDSSLEMKIYALNGTTALGMAQMIDKANAGTDAMNYQFSLYTAADAVTGAIVSGECAIAALPTNVAAKLYKASNGKLQLLALNTLGVLYLLDAGNTVNTLDDLRGKTVYLPGAGSNPEFITAALLQSAGLTVGTDVILDTTTYNSPDALQQAIISGQASLAVLPEPKVTVVTNKKSDIRIAMDLTAEWETLNGKNTLVQGCLVVNTDFAKAHPAEVAQFLSDYRASVEYVQAASDEAIQMIVNAEILPSAAVAKKALPKCNLCCITGTDMKTVMQVFCEKLFALNPASVGAVPDDGFYYVAQ